MLDKQIIFFINTVVVLISMWLVMYLNKEYISKALFDSKRFKLFELRDRLALLVMKGTLREDSEGYIYIRDAINFYIIETEDFKLVVFLKAVLHYNKNPEQNVKLGKLHTFLENHENNELRQIFKEFNITLNKIFGKRVSFAIAIFYATLKIIKLILEVIITLLKFLVTTLNFLDRLINFLNKTVEAIIREIDEIMELLDIRKNIKVQVGLC